MIIIAWNVFSYQGGGEGGREGEREGGKEGRQ